MNKFFKCSNCCFYDICDDGIPCDNYAPLDEELSDSDVMEITESMRYEYNIEYIQYLDKFYNS